MVLTNKVLTVSYGTFSCTLEGFDDLFGTMKAIAEYFRDLAADDRYFGAEPPQPDVDMLARIAQREVSRRVEAHSDGTGIVLRAADGPAMPPAGEHVETIEPAAAAAEVTPRPVVNAAEAAAPAPMPDASPEIMPEIMPELSDATPVNAEDVPVMAAQTTPETIDMDVLDETPAETEVVLTPEPIAEIISDTTAEATPEAEPEPAPAPDSIAAKLQRIRAVVSRAAHDEDETDFSEDEHADSFMTAASPDIAPAQPSEDAGLDLYGKISEIEELYEDEFEEETAEGDDLSVTMSELGLFDDSAPGTAPEDNGSVVADIQTDALGTMDAGDDGVMIESLLDEEFAEADFRSADFTDENDDREDTIFAGLDEPEPEAAADPDFENILLSDAEPQATRSDTPIRARVVKVRRADLESAIARGTLEEIDAQPDADSSLSDEAEADLMRELAEVEAELGPEFVDDTVNDAQDAQTAEPARPVASQQRDRIDADEDVSRLMEEADHKMDEPDSTTRRETYSQLRAAVAATKAERAISGEAPQLTHEKAFQDDLANVVRPRRPSASGASGQRPMGDRQAPLKLVAEQRVDDAAADARRGPVRPRRVSPEDVETALSGDLVGTPGGFAVFAHEAGATGLSELLEAAAAYMSYVEGRDQFSRPQLMTKVRQVEQEDFNREDGLRSFGQLLREGKIRKTQNGRFTASEDIGFKPAQRAAG